MPKSSVFPRLFGVLIIIITLVVLILSPIVVWKIVVSEKRAQSKILSSKSEQLVLDGSGSNDPSTSETYRKSLLEQELKAKGEYKLSLRVFWGYVIGVLVGSITPIGTGAIFLAVGKSRSKKNKIESGRSLKEEGQKDKQQE